VEEFLEAEQVVIEEEEERSCMMAEERIDLSKVSVKAAHLGDKVEHTRSRGSCILLRVV
jgi:hypothetical protein